MIRAVLFDFSGTLADCGPDWLNLELVTTVRAPLTLLRERQLASLTDDDLARADDIYLHLRQAAKETGVEISAYEATNHVAAALNIGLADEVIAAAVDELFYACLPDVQPIAGAIETLEALRQRSLTLGVISNARHGPFVLRALERLKMRHFFHTIVVSADVHLRKPRPEIFLNTLAGLGVPPHESAFVGDYHPYDIVGAQAAGMHSIWLVEPDRPHDDLPADVIIRRLPDLVPWVAAHL